MITVPLYPLLTNVIFLAEKDTQCPIPVPLDILVWQKYYRLVQGSIPCGSLLFKLANSPDVATKATANSMKYSIHSKSCNDARNKHQGVKIRLPSLVMKPKCWEP